MPHSPEVAEALERSIQHWRENREQSDPRKVCTNETECALCHMFNNNATDRRCTDCLDCPVYRKTGMLYCQDTPHSQAVSAICGWLDNPEDKSERNAFRAACDREIAFLESLRDTEERPDAAV